MALGPQQLKDPTPEMMAQANEIEFLIDHEMSKTGKFNQPFRWTVPVAVYNRFLNERVWEEVVRRYVATGWKKVEVKTWSDWRDGDGGMYLIFEP